jgi:DNA-binding MarR family transcriptional regulator
VTDASYRSETAEIRRGITRLARRVRSERPPGALSGNKIGVLAYLYREGASTPSAIALAEHQQPQSLSRVFAELQLAGLVSRRRDPADGRQFILSITDAGRAILRADMAARDRWLRDALLDGATDTERQLLLLAAGIMNRLAELPDVAAAAADHTAVG